MGKCALSVRCQHLAHVMKLFDWPQRTLRRAYLQKFSQTTQQLRSDTPAWQVFVLSQDNVKNKGYVTLFQYMTKNKKSLFAKVVMRAPEVLQVSAYFSSRHLTLFCSIHVYCLCSGQHFVLRWQASAPNTTSVERCSRCKSCLCCL